MGRRKKKINKEEICEDYCFQCKDGGALRICDYGDCLKAYHPKCVGEDDSFLESEVPWTCSWHFCFNCNNTPKFHCVCCPDAICGVCLHAFEFAVIGRKRGFCNHCCMLSGVIEGVEIPDLDLGKIDFDDPETYESFFKNYWLIIKQKERLTSVHVRDAVEQLNKYRILDDFSDLSGDEDSSQVEDEYTPNSSNDHSNDRKGSRKAMNKRKRNGENPSSMKRKVLSKKKEFNGWASNLLSEFLESIDKDKIEELSQYDVTHIVIQYCNENKLFDPVKRKKVVCDERLKTLLGRNSVRKNSIYNLLTPHFTVNLERFEDEYKHSSEDEDVNALVSCKKQRRSSSNVERPQNKESINPKDPQKNGVIQDVHRQGFFASMIAQNIKLLYLNRSLMEELLKEPETFEAKVIGSFVRIESDPFDYTQKNSHMLVKVTGVKKTSGNDEVAKEVLLQVSNMSKDVSICQLSNDNFIEEECEDLRRRVKDGWIKRPSVMEFKEKARILHEDITKQWIEKELYRLDKVIDKANEKGWRRELHAYIESKKLLETPSEQSRLLHEFPEIIADEIEVEPTDKLYSRKDLLPETDSREYSKPSTKDTRGDCVFPCVNDEPDFAEHERQCKRPESAALEQQNHTVSSDKRNDDGDNIHKPLVNERSVIELEEKDSDASCSQARPNSVLPERLKKKPSEPGSELIKICNDEQEPKKEKKGPRPDLIEICDDDDDEQDNTVKVRKEIIELSDDEEQHDTIGGSKKIVEDDPNSLSWYYMSPHCLESGPYSMSLLKQWNDAFPNELKLKVWNTNQSPQEAISVADAVRQFSRGK